MIRRTQFIKKRTDPYKDFVFGSDLITNGDFSDGSSWTTLGSEWTISNNVATFSGINSGSSNIRLGQSIPVQTFGTTFKIEFDISNVEAGKSAYFSIPGNWNANPTFNTYQNFEEGHHALFLEGISGNGSEYIIFGVNPSVNGNGGAFSISNISVKPIFEGSALYGEELVKNGSFSQGMNHWEVQNGHTDNWQIVSNGIENQGLNEAAVRQYIGDGEKLYKVELDAELNGGTYRVLDIDNNSIFLKNGRNVIFTTLAFGHIYIKPATEVLGANFTNISVKEVIHIPHASENLVINGGFSNGLNNWTLSNPGGSKGWIEINEEAVCSDTAAIANRNLMQTVMNENSFYEIAFNMSSNSNYIDLYAYSNFIRNTGVGSKKYYLKANSTNLLFHAGIDNDCSIDNISCRLINIVAKGENVLLNGDFLHPYNWIGAIAPKITIDNGKMDFDTNDNSGAYQNVLIQGKTYQLTYEISEYISGAFKPYTSSTGYMTSRSANGVYVETFTVNNTDSGKFWLRSASGFNGSISNVVLKEI